MPELVPGTKIWRIERRRVKGIGRYRVSSRTESLIEYRRRDAIVTKLIEAGEGGVQTLLLLKRRIIEWPELINADDAGTLRNMAGQILLFRPLAQTFDDWVSSHTSHRRGRPLAVKTAGRYRASWKRFLKLGQDMKLLPKDPVVGDLLRLDWAKLRSRWGASGYDWNNFRRTLSVFFSSALNQGLDRYREELMRRVPAQERFAKRVKAPMTVPEFWRIVEQVPPILQPGYVIMFRLALGPDAYLKMTEADLDPVRGVVHVPDDKNEYRRADMNIGAQSDLWPLLIAGVPCPIGAQALRRQWNKAVKAAGIHRRVRPYDIRHLLGIYLAEQGIPLQQISTYMRHATVTMTMHYLEGMETQGINQMLDRLLGQQAKLLPPPATTKSSAGPALPDPALSG